MDAVQLRTLTEADLPHIFRMQLDPESNRMAMTNPRTAEAFAAHWAKILPDPKLTNKAILFNEVMVGSISCFPHEDEFHVGYWIDREHWGQGIASRALELLLLEVTIRPLYAHVATSNSASLRVLQKCGFSIERVYHAPATDRYPACEEAILVLHPFNTAGHPLAPKNPGE